MTEKILFSYVSREDEDGIKIEISQNEDFFMVEKGRLHCDCMVLVNHPVDFTSDLHHDPLFKGYEESDARKTLSWLKSMYDDFYGDNETD